MPSPDAKSKRPAVCLIHRARPLWIVYMAWAENAAKGGNAFAQRLRDWVLARRSNIVSTMFFDDSLHTGLITVRGGMYGQLGNDAVHRNPTNSSDFRPVDINSSQITSSIPSSQRFKQMVRGTAT